jgi:hypothetical protein
MIDMLNLKVGDRLSLRDGLIAEVIENIGDGEWVKIRLFGQDGIAVSDAPEELCHYTDIIAVIAKAPD